MAVIELDRDIHPKLEILRKLAQGRLESIEVAALEEHLAACESCCLLLEEAPDDSFVGRLREARDLPAIDTLCNTESLTLSNEDEEPWELADHPRYRLIRLLGRGGMGAVYLAEHRHMARPVALKVINPELLNQRGSLARFQQEVRTAAKLDHPNIVAAYDADQAGNLHFLVMEHVEGQNLADYLNQKTSMPVSQACDIIRQAALGLQHAHDRGMVHRDIKPHNLMLTPSGQVKVLDFGLARFAAEPALVASQSDLNPAQHLTGIGAVMGSADYIAPEQARDAHAADCRSDIYSLGCTLYYLLTNRPPFPEGTAPEKLQRHGTDDPCLLAELRPEVPNELTRVVAKMMAKQPEDRYQSAAGVAEALTPFAVGSVPKKGKFHMRFLVGLALAMFSLAIAAGVIRLSAGDKEIVIETDDPTIEVVVKGDRIVRIADPKTGKAYQLDRNDLTLSLADDPDGLSVVLDGERPLTLKREGKRIATVRLVTPAPKALTKRDIKDILPTAAHAPAIGGRNQGWSPKGILRDKDGQPTYVLEDSKGKVLMYVTCQPGMTLRDYVGEMVTLYGWMSYRDEGDLRSQFITASHVAVYGPAPVEERTKVPPQGHVQMDVTMAEVDSAEARKLARRWLDDAKNEEGDKKSKSLKKTQPMFGVLKDRDGFLKDLSALTEKRFASMLPTSSVTTMSGRPAYVKSGGETPIYTTSDTGETNVTYKTFGTFVNLLAIILPNGKIHLEVRPEIRTLNPALGINIEGPKPASIPGFDVQSKQAVAQMKPGQTLVIGGLMAKEPNGSERELLILVTPRLIEMPGQAWDPRDDPRQKAIREVSSLGEGADVAIPPPPP